MRQMRGAAAILVLAMGASGQGLLNPARMPARAFQFEPQPGETTLHCEVRPIRAMLDFSFRFQSGYTVRVPMNQFTGGGHVWNITMRVTPEGGKPVYLGSRTRLPEIPKTRTEFDIDTRRGREPR